MTRGAISGPEENVAARGSEDKLSLPFTGKPAGRGLNEADFYDMGSQMISPLLWHGHWITPFVGFTLNRRITRRWQHVAHVD